MLPGCWRFGPILGKRNIEIPAPILFNKFRVDIIDPRKFHNSPRESVVADWPSRVAARKADGEHNPRSRLPAVILGAFISPAGCVVIGFALQSHLHWIATAIDWAMLSFGLTLYANVLMTYSVDCFRMRAGYVGVLVNIVKNGLAFGSSYAAMN